MNLKNLKGDNPVKDEANAPGIGSQIFVKEKIEVASSPPLVTPVDPANITFEELVSLSGDFTYVDPLENKWGVMYTQKKLSEFGADWASGAGSNGWNFDLVVFMPGTNAKALGIMTALGRVGELIIAVPDLSCPAEDRYAIMGSNCAGAEIESMRLGYGKVGTEDTKGVLITLKSYQAQPMLYTGTLEVEP